MTTDFVSFHKFAPLTSIASHIMERRFKNLNVFDLTQVERDRATLIQQTISGSLTRTLAV